MRKLAIFVEGYTEVVFVTNLIEQIAGVNRVQIEHKKIRGGSNARRTITLITGTKPETASNYFVLLFDCGGDNQVKTRIIEEHEGLTNSNFSKIIGLRDVRPQFTREDIPKLEQGLRTHIRTSLIPVEIVLAVMEIEAWFLAESTHFQRIGGGITTNEIRTKLAFDPETEDMSQRLTPADDLNACYMLGGETYSKSLASRTVKALDIGAFYLESFARCRFASKLINNIDEFLA